MWPSSFGVYHLDRSRIGRAWRAIRGTGCRRATGVDVGRLKLLAFAVGAGIAGAAGVLFAAWRSLFPPNFDFSVLIILYAMVVLGGWARSLGPLVRWFSPSCRALRDASGRGCSLRRARPAWRLYHRPWWRGQAMLGGVAVLGLALRLGWALAPGWFRRPALTQHGSLLAPLLGLISTWMLYPRDSQAVGNLAFVLLVPALLALMRVRAAAPIAPGAPALCSDLCLGLACSGPSVTRMLLLGALLVLMTYRPRASLSGAGCKDGSGGNGYGDARVAACANAQVSSRLWMGSTSRSRRARSISLIGQRRGQDDRLGLLGGYRPDGEDPLRWAQRGWAAAASDRRPRHPPFRACASLPT